MGPNAGTRRARWIGALAGLAPALAAIALLAALGATPNRDTLAWLVLITVVAVVDGWLLGPGAARPDRSDLRAALGYALVGSIVYVAVGTVMSVWAGPPVQGDLVSGLLWRVSGQVAYGLLYLPLWAGALAPFSLIWIVAVRALHRRAGPPAHGAEAPVVQRPPPASIAGPRRMGLFAAGLIVTYALFVAVFPLMLYREPRPPWSIDRPVALFLLFSVPAAIAVIGATRQRRTLLVAAGVICVVQAYVGFSGVTLGFLVPGILVLARGGAGRWPANRIEPPSALAFAVVATALTVAAWVATLGLTEAVCWTSTARADGTVVYERVAASNTLTVLPGQAASGCDSGTLTVEGMGSGAVLAIGAVAVAAASTWAPRHPVEPG